MVSFPLPPLKRTTALATTGLSLLALFPFPVSLLLPSDPMRSWMPRHCPYTTHGSLDPNEAPLGPLGYPGGENSLLASGWHDVMKVGQGGTVDFD